MTIVEKIQELIDEGRFIEVRRPYYPVPFDFFTAVDGLIDSGADKDDGQNVSPDANPLRAADNATII